LRQKPPLPNKRHWFQVDDWSMASRWLVDGRLMAVRSQL
jgi:hypothetical protein